MVSFFLIWSRCPSLVARWALLRAAALRVSDKLRRWICAEWTTRSPFLPSVQNADLRSTAHAASILSVIHSFQTVHGDRAKRLKMHLTDAVAESSGEGDVCIRRPSRWILRQKAFRPELLGLREESRVTVQSVGYDDGISTFGHLKTIYRNERNLNLTTLASTHCHHHNSL